MIAVYPVEDVKHLTDNNCRHLPDTYLLPKGTTEHQFVYVIYSE